MRTLLKKWYKFKQNQQKKKFHSHWYMRFGWLDQPFSHLNQLKNLHEIHSPRKFTFADSFYAKHNNRHFIFFEEVDDQHPVGFLSVLETFEDGTFTDPTPILKLDYHLSYPCVFEVNNQWYMIPETSENNTIELWKCTNFPYTWQKEKNLLENINAVDATPFYYQNMWYIFTSTKENCKKFGDRLDIYYTPDILNEPLKPHAQNPVATGQQSLRMAGKPFYFNQQLVRPSQDSLKRYGGHIELKKITQLSPTAYQEEPLLSILPDWNEQDDGCHTIHVDGHFVVLDAIRLTRK